MLPIATWFLLITLSFTNGLTTQNASPRNEDTSSTDIYIYEEQTTDDALLVEENEEEQEKNMQYEQAVTDTTSNPQPNNIENFKEKMNSQNVSEAPIREQSSPTRKFQEYRQEIHGVDPTRTWKNLSYLPAMPKKNPTVAEAPKWKDLNDILKYHPNLQLSGYALKISQHRHNRHKNPHKTSVAPDDKAAPTKHDHTRKHVHSTPSPLVTSTHSQLNQDITTTIRAKVIKMKHCPPTRRAHQLVNRGSYKFRMDDVNDMRL